MGCWGNKIGDSDETLDIFEDACRNDMYLESLINRTDIVFYGNWLSSLCAIAIVDASVNGIDNRIWSNYILDDEKYSQTLNHIANTWNSKWHLLHKAYERLILIHSLMENETEDEVMGVINILASRLSDSIEDINKLFNRRKGD